MALSMSGWITPSSYIFGGSLAEWLRFAGVQHAFWKEVVYKMRVSTAPALASSSSSQLFNMHFGRKSRRIMASFCRCSTCTLEGSLVQNAFSRDSGRTKCCVVQYKEWLRTWQVKLCGTTVAERPRVILGSCSDHVRIVPPL